MSRILSLLASPFKSNRPTKRRCRVRTPQPTHVTLDQHKIADQAFVRRVFNRDVMECIYKFLTFEDITQCVCVSKQWNKAYKKAVCKRMCEERWGRPVVPDPGIHDSSRSVPFELRDSEWRIQSLARERAESEMDWSNIRGLSNEDCSLDRCHSIMDILDPGCVGGKPPHPPRRAQHPVVHIECLRVLTEIFDRFYQCRHESDTSVVDVPAFSMAYKDWLHSLLESNLRQSINMQIIAKAMGVLALNESNRKMLTRSDIPQTLVNLLMAPHCASETVVSILWALVIMCRPIGGREGQTLVSFAEENFATVHTMNKIGGVYMILNTIKNNLERPRILAKAFWAIVNLALVEEVKAYMIDHGAVEWILGSLKKFPDEKDMNYRGIFALINLGIRASGKAKIAEHNGVVALLDVMKRWPDCPAMQRCGCNVMRSLMVGDEFGLVAALRANGANELLGTLRGKFAEDDDLEQIITQTRFLIETF